jgi:aspartate/methionine/tyrosine aminotransferase
MFSRRVPEPNAMNRLSRRIEETARAGATILDLTESNPTRCGFDYETVEILRSIASPASLIYEPHPQGLPAARQAIARWYSDQGVPAEPDALFLTSGTSEAYGHLFKLLADPGDEILVPVPGYPLLEVLTRLDSVRIVHYPLRCGADRGWSIDLERLGISISTRTRAIVVVSPNNPTGSFLKRNELAAIAALCERHAIALIVDEVFSEYGRGSDSSRVVTAAGHAAALTFVLNGFSKMLGLPQVKLSWIHVSGPSELRAQACARLGFVTDAYLSVGAPVMNAAAFLLRGREALQAQIRGRLDENEERLRSLLGRAGGMEVLAREGGWYAVVRLPDGFGDEEVALGLLDREGVLVHPGFFYDFPVGAHLVLSLLSPVDVFREGVTRLASSLERMRASDQ